MPPKAIAIEVPVGTGPVGPPVMFSGAGKIMMLNSPDAVAPAESVATAEGKPSRSFRRAGDKTAGGKSQAARQVSAAQGERIRPGAAAGEDEARVRYSHRARGQVARRRYRKQRRAHRQGELRGRCGIRRIPQNHCDEVVSARDKGA